jgi:hypothetical protein
MQKKTDIHELDIPKDDVECWNRYTKFHWVYDLSRLFEAQSLKWSPFKTEEFFVKRKTYDIISANSQTDSYIYTKDIDGDLTISEVYLIKGELKYMRHINSTTLEELPLNGQIELRLNAFSTLYFQKFTGVITIETIGIDIVRIRLRPYVDIMEEKNHEVIKLLRRIYKKSETSIINGLTDQVHQESLAS